MAQTLKLKRILLFILLAFGVLLLLFAVLAIGPLDRTPASAYDGYDETLENFGKINASIGKDSAGEFYSGFSKVSLVPPFRTATAGYGKRRGRLFEGVRDSIFVRTLVIANGSTKSAIVSADLLLVPPEVTLRLEDALKGTGFDLNNTYLAATHTHNSIGNWGQGATQLLYGSYEEEVIDFITNQIVESITRAASSLKRSSMYAGKIAVPDAVENRLVRNGPEDPWLRVIKIVREDSSRLAVLTYNAHATCLYAKDMELSADYPGALTDSIENHGYAFAMYMAGAVGSHKSESPSAGEICIGWTADKVSAAFLENEDKLAPMISTALWSQRSRILLGDPQVKIGSGVKVRGWLFDYAFGEYRNYLTAMRVGDVVFLGTPCDFSGELTGRLDSIGSGSGLLPFTTSFNGSYIGYVTPAARYDLDHYETQLMNWYPPGTGEFMQECLEILIKKASEIDRESATSKTSLSEPSI